MVVNTLFTRSAVEDGKAPHSPFAGAGGRTEARFDFFLPDFSGYTLQNYRNDLDENKVEVVYLHAGDSHEAEPDAPGEYPPNMLKRSLKEHLNPKDFRDMYGLRCYTSRVLTERGHGRRHSAVCPRDVRDITECLPDPQGQLLLAQVRRSAHRLAHARAQSAPLAGDRRADLAVHRRLERRRCAGRKASS